MTRTLSPAPAQPPRCDDVPPTVSVVVVTYRTPELTRRCLRSIPAAVEDLAHEVLLVDNGDDGTAAAVAAELPAVHVWQSPTNVGFARAVNAAASRARGEFLVLVNPDAELEPGSVRSLVELARRQPDGGLYGGELVADDGSIAPESYSALLSLRALAGFAAMMPSSTRRTRALAGGYVAPPPAGGWRRVGYVTGAFLLVPSRLWQMMGGFDERFTMYGEDLDLGMRVARAGHRPIVTSQARARHRSGASSTPTARAVMILAGKSTAIRKHWAPPARRLGLLLLLLGTAARAVVQAVAPGTGRSGTDWREVFRARSDWLPGYPPAVPEAAGRPASTRVMGWPSSYGWWANPYSSLLSGALAATGRFSIEDLSRRRLVTHPPDILHVHWPEWALRGRRPIVEAAATIVAMGIARARGTAVVWTAHNVEPHERFDRRLGRWYWRAFTGLVDATTTLDADIAAELFAAYARLARRPSRVVRHGHYRDAYPSPPSKHEARSRLGLAGASSVTLCFGQLRRYKDIPALLDAFGAHPDPAAVLVIAGPPADAEVAAEVEAGRTRDRRVHAHPRAVPHDLVPTYFAAADLVVLPYSRVWMSGAALTALSFDRPVLLPDSPVFRELRAQVGASWVKLFERPLTARHLAEALAAPPAGHAPLDAFGWGAVAEQTAALYDEVRRRPRR